MPVISPVVISIDDGRTSGCWNLTPTVKYYLYLYLVCVKYARCSSGKTDCPVSNSRSYIHTYVRSVASCKYENVSDNSIAIKLVHFFQPVRPEARCTYTTDKQTDRQTNKHKKKSITYCPKFNSERCFFEGKWTVLWLSFFLSFSRFLLWGKKVEDFSAARTKGTGDIGRPTYIRTYIRKAIDQIVNVFCWIRDSSPEREVQCPITRATF